VRTGRSGWYLRVVAPGVMAAGDAVELVERLAPRWTIAAVLAASYRRPADRGELSALVAEPRLAAAWRRWLDERLAAG
jgi:MOSC domain-containing protein YiiM